MTRAPVARPIFELSIDGTLTQSGYSAEFSSERTATFASVAEEARRLRNLYVRVGLDVSRSPSLLALLTRTEALAAGTPGTQSLDNLLAALQTQRLAEALLPLHGLPGAREKLAEILDGELNLLYRGARNRSKAKDTFWELELYRVLADCGIKTSFAEPDLMVGLAGSDTGVACKKLYSEANVAKVLSQAIRQIERNCTSGIVALDLEDLFPSNAILQVPSTRGMATRLEAHNYGFMQRHERHLRRYLEPGRAISVVVSCATITDILDRSPRFFNARQTTLWNIPNRSHVQSSQVDAILNALLSTHPA